MKWIIGLFLGCIAYSVVRYVVFAPENAPNIPAFIVNKGVSMGAALCFLAAFVQQWRRNRRSEGGVESGVWFRAGVFGVIWHVPMSLAILGPGYFTEFYGVSPEGASASGRMTPAGELVFCFGGLAAGLLYLVTRPAWSAVARHRLSLAAMLVLLAHVLAMGYCRGLNIKASHGYLPPMWLLSAVGIAAAAVVLLACGPRGGEQRGG